MVSSGIFGKIAKYHDVGGAHPFVVYLALNRLTGDFYVGATEKGTRGREAIHLSHARHGGKKQYFYRAIRKYGEENFKFMTIKECTDYWDALESERAYIALLNPRYNMTDGGGGVKGYHHSPESKARMSAAKKGKPSFWTKTKMPQDVRDKLAAARHAERGKPKTGRALVAILATAKLGNAARRRPVVCLNTGVEYESCAAAGLALGVPPNRVSHSCNAGATLRINGLRFDFLGKK